MTTSIQKRRLLLAMSLTLVVACGHAWLVSQVAESPPLQLSDWQTLSLNYPVIADAMLELMLPILALYLYSTTAQFREAVSTRATAERLAVLRPLTFIQLLAVLWIAAIIAWTGENATISLFIVLVGGLLGGWRTGLALGIWRGLLWWGIELLFYADINTTSVGALLGDVLFWYGFMTIEIVAGLWLGLLAGWFGDWWGKKRFQPVPSFLLGLMLNLFVGLLLMIASGAENYVLPILVPVGIAGGLAMAGFAFIVQNAKGLVAQQQAAVAEQARLQAELRALQAQINPHFLFNSLNTIRYFIRADTGQARRLLLDLSTVFQRVLRSGDFITLADELSYVEAYLNLEKARLGERLTVQLPAVDEPLASVKVPALILQPLVENATVHGIGKQKRGGTVVVEVSQMANALRLVVRDDGVGIPPDKLSNLLDPSVPTSSIGLRNTNGRLQAIYGEAHKLHIESQPDGGTRVVVQIPLEERNRA